MPIAFFDLDLTLLSVNSGSLWIRREVALGRLPLRRALRAATWLAQYQLGLTSQATMISKAIASAAGESAVELAARTASFFETQVRSRYRPGGLAALEAHRQAGDRLVLLSSSSHFMAELVAKDLRLDGILCNRLEVGADGLLTGLTVGPVCFGEGKLVAAKTALHGESLERCTFYTDSYSDLPVMEVVGTPVAVNADWRLARHAQRRGWRVVDWGRP